MERVGCESFSDYLDYLEVHPDEYEQLFEMLLINVTEFFRDPAGVAAPAREVLPELLAAKAPASRCASGARAARAARRPTPRAIVFAELMGVDAFRERVKIYATDIDEDALDQARLATYNAKETESVPRGAARALLRARRSAAGVPQGPSPHGHLRPQQPRRRTPRSRGWTC